MLTNKSSNPVLGTFNKIQSTSHETMSINGTSNKTLILLILLLISGFFAWTNAQILAPFYMPIFLGVLVISIAIAIFLAFKPLLAKYLAPVYAILEGVFLGLISLFFETMYPGIVFQAIILTILVAFFMNVLYRTRIIKVTRKFRSILMLCVLSIMGIYLISIALSFFGTTIPLIHESGPIGIIFSLAVVTIASLTLLLDFDFIERATQQKLPKAMEWYGAFGLIVSLIWIYLEILKLLAKLRNNR